jgi:transposase InsO family protein
VQQRRAVSTWIEEACAAGARLKPACEAVGLSVRTLQRWRSEDGIKADARAAAAQVRTPGNRLSETERARILAVCNAPEFADRPPSQIVPALADQGCYIASEASFYRVLRAHDQLAHRGKARAPSHRRPEPVTATAPNQLWSWDITYLATTLKGSFFYLYLILDVFSRKIVGWEVFAEESSTHAAALFEQAHRREGVDPRTLTLHSDNGAPMKGATMLATLQRLGVVPSFSRPGVSNDNPYSEALFKTLKYQPTFPSQPFEDLDQAHTWVAGFVEWYNEHHRHSALKFVTPGQRHRGQDQRILLERARLYEAARAQHPERWSGATRNWEPDTVVLLNPGKATPKKEVEILHNDT